MAITNQERVGKALELLNTLECYGRSIMEWIDQARICLAESLPKGSRMIVFGSQARGDARPDSDLDLLVIEPVLPPLQSTSTTAGVPASAAGELTTMLVSVTVQRFAS